MKARYSGLRPVSSVAVASTVATRGRLAAFTSSPEKPGSCGAPVLSDCRQREVRCLPGNTPWDHTLTHTQGWLPRAPPLAEWGAPTTVDSAGVTLMAKEEGTTC